MSVVLRCPTCGTTQGHPGECEACSEGHVRYFCTNHEQGMWLDGPVCTHCGSKFGDVSRTPPTRPPTTGGRAITAINMPGSRTSAPKVAVPVT